ncbi:DUF4167 domain-containing protein [Pararhizobium arenae]|uniref:DUF4167 domain-containing protein n=1 Tax=Pararhizobium arenae TaxID=1856850 RepID=UPI00094AE879|nr:DUF4167 domain-containing protein [Pararhizobium arenae]
MTSRRITKPKGVELPTRQRSIDRYKQHLQFAELKISAGDRIGAENNFQQAEHFFRAAAEQKDTDQI